MQNDLFRFYRQFNNFTQKKMKDQIGKTLQIGKKADVDSEFKDVKACIYSVASAQALRYACKMIFLGYTGT